MKRKVGKVLICIGVSLLMLTNSLFSFTFAGSSDLDTLFDTKTPFGFNGAVRFVFQQSDGKILVGGAFTRYQGVTANKLVRLNSDGTLDEAFSTAIGSRFGSITNGEAVKAIAQQSDGKILVGGSFNIHPCLVRLNLDGSIDSSFSAPSNVNDVAITAIAIASNGDIITSLSTVAMPYIQNILYRLDTNGTILNQANLSDGLTQNGDTKGANIISIQPNGKIIVGGDFTTYQGMSANYIIGLQSNLDLDSSFTIGNGFDGIVHSIKTQNDGKILVGGEFSNYNGSGTNKIVRLNINGSIDSSFSIGSGFDANIYNINTQSDGKILVGGAFSTYKGSSVKNIVRLTTGGTIDSSFVSGQIYGAVKHTTIQSDGKVLLATSSINDGFVARISASGTKDTSFGIGRGFNGFVYESVIQSDGKIIVGGDFTRYGDTFSQRLIRLNTDGSVDTSFSPWTGFNRRVTAIALQSDGKIIVGGDFQIGFIDGVSMPVVRLNTDGSLDTSFSNANDINAYVKDIAIQSDGKILVLSSNWDRLTRLNTDGTKDYDFSAQIGGGFPNTPLKVAIQSDGKILVGGAFPTFQGVSSNGLVRLTSNGARDTSFNVGAGVGNGGVVYDIKTLSDGKILIGGYFLTYNGVSRACLARINSDGSLDTSFTIGNGFSNPVQTINVQSDGKILVGGHFFTYSGANVLKLARLDNNGILDTGFDVKTGFNQVVNSIELNPTNGRIFIGGEFTSFGSTPAGYFVSLYGDNPVVSLPNSKVSTVINDAFTTQGYTTTSDGTFVGDTPISLTDTDGSIPTDISILNDNIQLSLTENTQIKDSSANNYRGTILAPSTNIVNSANDKEVFSSFNVGTNSQVLALNGGQARITVPVNGLNEGDSVNVYYSTDNGVSWTLDSTTTVIDNNGSHYVEISTNHLGDFVITSPGNTRTFNINNGDTYTLTGNVNLNISVDPVAQYMRFSNDDITWTDWETYSSSKSRNLGNEGGTKTVFVEFDTDGDGDGDIKTSDSILYYVWSVEINSGDLKTTSLDVSLSVKVSPIPAQLMIYDEEVGGSWESYVGDIERDWTLPVITPEEPGKGGEDTGSGKIETTDIAGSIVSTSTGGLVERYIYVDIDTDGDGIADIHTNDSILYGSDITAPIPSISYSTTSPTNSNVIATISFNEPTTITNNSGSASYEFTNNGSFTFEFTDIAGNTGSATATVSWILPRQSSNGGGDTMQKDICIDGDESPSYYDGMCVAKDTNTTLATATMADAYKRAFENGITTKPSIEEAAMDIAISRAELAKMISQYATEIKNKTPDTSASCIFTDIADVTPDLIPYIEESCQLGIMGRNSDGSIATSFNPYGLVTRGEFATVLSRVLWGNKYDGATEYYAGHIAALYNEGIIANTDPLLIEARGYVMLMMMRASMISD